MAISCHAQLPLDIKWSNVQILSHTNSALNQSRETNFSYVIILVAISQYDTSTLIRIHHSNAMIFSTLWFLRAFCIYETTKQYFYHFSSVAPFIMTLFVSLSHTHSISHQQSLSPTLSLSLSLSTLVLVWGRLSLGMFWPPLEGQQRTINHACRKYRDYRG